MYDDKECNNCGESAVGAKVKPKCPKCGSLELVQRNEWPDGSFEEASDLTLERDKRGGWSCVEAGNEYIEHVYTNEDDPDDEHDHYWGVGAPFPKSFYMCRECKAIFSEVFP